MPHIEDWGCLCVFQCATEQDNNEKMLIDGVIEGYSLLSENSYAFRAGAVGVMGGVGGLYPGLSKTHGFSELPEWPDPKAPWSILEPSSEHGLMAQIERLIEGLPEGSKVPSDVRLDTSAGRVHIHPSASIGQFVRIEGPCYIGADAEVRHAAYLRRGSWICEGGVVGHATEVKNSVFLPGAKAPHFNYVGDSILGFGVNLGAGTKLSNVRNDRREIRVMLEGGTWSDTGLRKMGALVGDGCEVGCNVVTNPGAILAPGTMVHPNETVTGWLGPPRS